MAPERVPRISVVMPVRDNAAHVGAAIRSILDQTFDDFELIVVDDGSLDETARRVRELDDQRILFLTQRHEGVAHATNRAVEVARGRHVAFFGGDHLSRRHRLERQLAYLEESGARAVFSWADFIDDDGRELTGPHYAGHLFNHPQRTRPETLRRFFFEGNYLCTVSALIERDLLRAAGPLPETSAQMPDFHLWCRLLCQHELHVLPERLVAYRVRADGGGVSSPRNAVRACFELLQLHREELGALPADLFRDAFAAELRNPGFAGPVEQELELAFLWLRHRVPHLRHLGAERLYGLLRDSESRRTAETRYGFGLADLALLTSSLDLGNASEHLLLRDHAIALEEGYRLVAAALADAQDDYRRLEASAQDDYRRLEASAQDHYRRLEANGQDHYRRLASQTREALAAKDDENASLRETVRAAEGELEAIESCQRRAHEALAAKDEESASLRETVRAMEDELRAVKRSRLWRAADWYWRLRRAFGLR